MNVPSDLSKHPPATLDAARRWAEFRAGIVGHTLGPWRVAGVLWSFHDTPGSEEQASCTSCGACAVAKVGHNPGGSAVTLACLYVQLMRRRR